MEHAVDLRLLRALVSVAEHGGFSTAAAALHITQPALSRRIRDLESALGLRLFDRTSRRVRLTAGGEALLTRSRELLAGAEALRERAEALKSGSAGTLKVGGTPFILESLLAPFLSRYRRRHSDVEVQIYEHGGVRLLDDVLRGDLHLAVVTALEPRLASRPLFPWRALAVVARTHPLARRRTVDIDALMNEPLLALPPQYTLRRLFDAACETAHLHPKIRLESATAQTLVAMARAGYGVAVVPSAFVIQKHGLKALPILVRGESLGRWTAINWNAHRFQLPYVNRFADELAEFARRRHPGQEYGFAPPIARNGPS